MKKAFLLSTLLLLMTPRIFACGGEYVYWYNISGSLAYDPDNQESPPAYGMIYNAVFPSASTYNSGKYKDFKQELNRVSTKAGRKLSGKLMHSSANHYSWGRCRSNSVDAAIALIEAVAGDKAINNTEYNEIVKYRHNILASCRDKDRMQQLVENLAEEKGQYKLYIKAIAQFYLADFSQAAEMLKQLENSNKPWLAETSSYLLGRLYQLQAQAAWRGYHKTETSIDHALVDTSINQFNKYLSAYSNGRYSDSALGLVRRGHWLKDDIKTYTSMLKAAILKSADILGKKQKLTDDDINNFSSLLHEAAPYLLKTDDVNPLDFLIGAMMDKLDNVKNKSQFHTGLRRARKLNQLHNMYRQKAYAEILAELKPRKDKNMLESIILARTLEAGNKLQQANAVWLTLRNNIEPQKVDLQLANNAIDEHGYEGLFNKKLNLGEGVTRLFLAQMCGVSEQHKLLKKLDNPEQQHIIAFNLAMRYLMLGDIKALHELLENTPEQTLQELSLIRTATKMIVTGSNPGKGYLNVAYFMNKKAIKIPPSIAFNALGRKEKSPTKCAQMALTESSHDPYFYYQKSLQYYTDKNALTEAKALHYLVKCHKSGESTRSCRWHYSYSDKTSAKPWFKRLHSKYKNSKWAKKTKIYY